MTRSRARTSSLVADRNTDPPDVTSEDLDSYLGDGHVAPIHPGIIYRDWIIRRRGFHVNDVADKAGISREMLHRILRGDASITARTAIGLAEVAGTEPEFWLRAQTIFNLWTERERRKAAQSHHAQ